MLAHVPSTGSGLFLGASAGIVSKRVRFVGIGVCIPAGDGDLSEELDLARFVAVHSLPGMELRDLGLVV